MRTYASIPDVLNDIRTVIYAQMCVLLPYLQILFLEDGTMVVTTGDGGGAGDPENAALNM